MTIVIDDVTSWDLMVPGVPAELSAALYDIDDLVIPVAGPFLGYVGAVDGLDLADDAKPFRVRFDLDGESFAAWYGADDLLPAWGVA